MKNFELIEKTCNLLVDHRFQLDNVSFPKYRDFSDVILLNANKTFDVTTSLKFVHNDTIKGKQLHIPFNRINGDFTIMGFIGDPISLKEIRIIPRFVDEKLTIDRCMNITDDPCIANEYVLRSSFFKTLKILSGSHPKTLHFFNCEINSLEGIPPIIDGNVAFSSTGIKSFEHFPEKIKDAGLYFDSAQKFIKPLRIALCEYEHFDYSVQSSQNEAMQIILEGVHQKKSIYDIAQILISRGLDEDTDL